MSCAGCDSRACARGGEYPEDCTSKLVDNEVRDDALAFYRDEENYKILQAAAKATSAAIGGKWPRVRELVFFAHSMGAKRIGIASCISYAADACILAGILTNEGFEVVDATCRIGSIKRGELGLEAPDDPHFHSASCNPYMQAAVLNEVGTDFNVILGLCLGHDMIFARQSQAWVTTLGVKDQTPGAHQRITDTFKHYVAIEALRQDLYDAATLESMGGCGSQLAAGQGIMGASEEQLLEMAHESGIALSRYELE